MSFRVQGIKVIQFKNFISKHIATPADVVVITGANGSGKTTLLDAINYACFTKSHFLSSDAQAVNKLSNGFRIEIDFSYMLDGIGMNDKVTCTLRETGKKDIAVNGVAVKKFSSHIGQYPSVMIAPDDIELLTGSAELRRAWIDRLISQTNKEYLEHLIHYNKLLAQRNSLLKRWPDSSLEEKKLLDLYDQMLPAPAHYIMNSRKYVVQQLTQKTCEIYKLLSSDQEQIQLQYDSILHNINMQDLLVQRKDKDLLLQRTTHGVHRDDIQLQLNDMPVKTAASQGQRKSILFALKLAELEWISLHQPKPPLLLLDDVFEKLDTHRAGHLLNYIHQLPSQVFITDTNESLIRTAMGAFASNCIFLHL